MKKSELRKRIKDLTDSIIRIKQNQKTLENKLLGKDLEQCNNILKKYGETVLEMNRERVGCGLNEYLTTYTITLYK